MTPDPALLTGHTSRVFSMAFSPDGNLIAIGSEDATVRLWDVATREPIGAPLCGHAGFVVNLIRPHPPYWNRLRRMGSDPQPSRPVAERRNEW
ncbi:WD40 repeat domain-containing protein [Nocardia noduli]|uniref:WD40 repeat domain-containing protein n=1 Tax=Nocardia noduli TaxID=2815722 RepID=UPI001C2279E5|nr:hypothetical protein [Nocardia noduli]